MGRDKHIGYALRETRNLMHRFVENRIAVLGYDDVSFAQGGIVHYIYEHPDERVYQRDLEQFFRLRRSTVTGLLQGLEKNGYIERRPVEEDARLKQIVLREKGVKMEETMHGIMKETENIFAEGFTEEEKEQLFMFLERIRKNIEERERNDKKTD